MIIIVDCSVTPSVRLSDPGNFYAFSVATTTALDHLDAVLTDTGVGSFDGEYAWISADRVRRLAAGFDGVSDWGSQFDGMVAFARAHDWWDETTGCIRAHVEGSLL